MSARIRIRKTRLLNAIQKAPRITEYSYTTKPRLHIDLTQYLPGLNRAN